MMTHRLLMCTKDVLLRVHDGGRLILYGLEGVKGLEGTLVKLGTEEGKGGYLGRRASRPTTVP